MRAPFRFGAVVLAAVLSLAAPALPEGAPVGGSGVVPGDYLDHFGLEMSAQEAMERITFHPFVPTTSYLAVALLPAFHGDDKDHPQNRGIGYEYSQSGVFYILREWPRAGGSISSYTSIHGPKSCPESFVINGPAKAPHAVAWQTAALVFALQPDIEPGSAVDAKKFRAEWERLAKRGACR